MKRLLSQIFLLGLIGLVLGGGIAYLLYVMMYSSASSPDHDSKPPNIVSLQESSIGDDEARNYDPTLRQFEDSSLTTHASELASEIYSFVALLPEQDLGVVLRRTANSSFRFQEDVQHKLQQALLERLTIFNPNVALNFALNHGNTDKLTSDYSAALARMSFEFAAPPTSPPKFTYIETVFKIWAMNDLATAVAQGKQLDTSTRRLAIAGILASQVGESFQYLQDIASEMGEESLAVDAFLLSFNVEQLEDPKSAWEMVSSLITARNLLHEWVLKNILLRWYEIDGVSLVDEIQSSNLSDNIKSNTILLVLTRAAREVPKQALQVALNIPNDKRYKIPIVRNVVGTWTNFDPQAAFKYLDQVDDEFFRNSLPQTVVSTWARNDPHYVLENLDNFAPDLQQIATSSALGSISQTDPQLAAEHALTISSEGTRTAAFRQVLRNWMQQDLEEVIDWVDTTEASGQQRFELVSTLTSWLVSDDPVRAFELARSQNVLDWDNVGLEADIIRSIAQWEGVEMALDLLGQVREGKTRAVATAKVADQLINNGEIDAAIQLGLELPEAEQLEFFPQISRVWSRIDANGLVESIEQLPTAELRSAFVSTVLRESSDDFTEEQMSELKKILTDSPEVTD